MKSQQSWFSASLVVILILTAVAKLISAAGTAHLLALPDPVFAFSNRSVILLAALLEIALTLSILIGGWSRATILASLWFSSILVIYRIALSVVAPSAPCPCLGTLTEQLHVSSSTASVMMSCVVGYIF